MKNYITLLILFITYTAGYNPCSSQTTYTFTGNGNWNDSTNWLNQLKPDSVLVSGSAIIINPVLNGECILNVPQVISTGGQLTVLAGARFRILGDLNIFANNSFTDSRDGQVYAVKQFGTQIWMAQNLNYADSGSFCSDTISNNCSLYGRLYTWDAALQAVPQGWHLPSDSEWSVLITYLGGDSIAGGKMKEAGFEHWQTPNTGADDSSSLNMLPNGYRDAYSGIFYDQAYYGNWWSSSENTANPANAWYYYLAYNKVSSLRSNYDKQYGFSVRCVKN